MKTIKLVLFTETKWHAGRDQMVRFNKNNDVELWRQEIWQVVFTFLCFPFSSLLEGMGISLWQQLSCVQSLVLEAVQGVQPGPSCSAAQPCWSCPRGLGLGCSCFSDLSAFCIARLLFKILVWFLMIFFGEMSWSLMSKCSILNANRNSTHFIYCGLWLHFQNYGFSSSFLLELGLAKELNC